MVQMKRELEKKVTEMSRDILTLQNDLVRRKSNLYLFILLIGRMRGIQWNLRIMVMLGTIIFQEFIQR